MRILHVNKFLYRRGGAEGYLLDVAALQRAAGHVVDVWGMDHPDNDRPLPLQDTFAPYVELEKAPGGLKTITASARMVWSPSSRRGIEKALERFRPDLVHMHNIYHQLSPSILGPIKRAGIPSVMTLHDYKLACPSYQMLDHDALCDRCVGGGTWHAAVQRCKSDSLGSSAILAFESGIHRALHAYSPVDVFISPSHFLYDVMARSGIAKDRLRVIANVVQEQGNPPAAAPSEGDVATFVFAGRLSHEKGVDTLIEAVGLCGQEIRLEIAGDGPDRGQLELLASEKAPGRVRFRGRLSKSELSPLVTGAVASVVPSRWYENQPMTILESFGAAVPVIASDLGGMPELVRDGQEGLVVPYDDPPALAAALTTLAGDRAGAHRMGLAARARLLREFTPEQHLRALGETYAYAAARHEPAGRPGTATVVAS